MTSAAPGAHPDPEEVDALLDPAGGDPGVAAHVAGCGTCARVREDLAQVRALLAEQARQVPAEPADLGARIAAALAAEPPLASTPPLAAPHPAPQAGPPWGPAEPATTTTSAVADLDAHRRRRRRATTWFAAAASVAVVALGGTLLLPGLLGGADDSSAGAAEDAGVGAEPPPAAQPSVDPSDVTGSPSRGSSVQGGAGVVDVSGTDYTAAGLPDQAARLLAASPGGSGDDLAEAPEADAALERLRALPTCLTALGYGTSTRAVDLATYDGEPATVVVLDDRGSDLVVVVPAGCGAGDDRLLDSAPLP